MRDSKLRYLFKERYDYRANLIDWDFNANLIGVAPIVHFISIIIRSGDCLDWLLSRDLAHMQSLTGH